MQDQMSLLNFKKKKKLNIMFQFIFEDSKPVKK